MFESVKKYIRGDRVIWAIFLALAIISVLSVYSSSYRTAYAFRSGQVGYYLVRHVIFIFFGFLLAYITHLIPYRLYSRISQLLVYITIPLLVITLFFGVTKNDATRWIELGGFSFQTSDLAKLALVMYVARLLSLKQEKIRSYKEGFLPILYPVVIICILIMPANLSTALILLAVCIILMFIGRVRFLYITYLGFGATTLLVIFILVAVQLNWEGRMTTWYNRVVSHTQQDISSKDIRDQTYQSDQSKAAIATGGIFGKGPGNSRQRGFLPEPHSDFIYSIIVEEYGLLGGALVILLYLALLYRAGLIVRKCTRTFAAFLVVGLGMLMVFQAMVNMAVAVGIFPVTGQPLPMISMGGTSMIFTSVAVGMILSVSHGIKVERKEVPADEA
ncbi:MAG: FtsW/RodA/SpoVE family cell cycle protein [Bacteroidales bacterium]|nr:FtsW/RodA/SpoVE family cell cycle protein [Bacteroidales bacterium]